MLCNLGAKLVIKLNSESKILSIFIMKLETLVIFALTLKSRKVNITLFFAFQCPDGGIGRRARLKLVFLGVWVRFPLRVLIKSLIS